MYTVESQLTLFANTAAAGTVGSGATSYHTLYGGGLNASENVRQAPLAKAGTFTFAYLVTSTSQPSSGSLVVTLRVNNADTSVVVTVAANSAAGSFYDLSNTATASAGQVANWKFKNNATGTSAATIGIGVYYFANDSHWSVPKMVFVSSGTTITYTGSSGTLYEYIIGSGITTTENQRQSVFPFAGTLKFAYLKTGTSQPASGSLVRTLRKNGADTSIVITVAAGSAGGVFSDLTNSVSVAAGDLINWKIVNNATKASSTQIANSIYFY